MKPFTRLIPSVFYRVNPVLPQAYDDSLSYFEVLAKLQKKVNELVEAVNQIFDAVEELDNRLTIVEGDVSELKEKVTNIINTMSDYGDRITALENRPTPVQSDWNETNTSSLAYIRNKPEHIEVDIATTETAGIVKPDGTTILVENDGTISVDGENIDISNNTSITNLGDRIDDIIAGTTEIDISNNSSITNLGDKIDDIIDGTTEIDISNNSTITDIIDGTTPIDISNNSSITNLGDRIDDIIDGTTNIDISNNSSITNLGDKIDDIIDGTTPIDISGNSSITDLENRMLTKESYASGLFTLLAPRDSQDVPMWDDIANCELHLQSMGDAIVAQLLIPSNQLPSVVSGERFWEASLGDVHAIEFLRDKSFLGYNNMNAQGGFWSLGTNYSWDKYLGRLSINKLSPSAGGTGTLTVHMDLQPYTLNDLDPYGQNPSTVRGVVSGTIMEPFTFVTYDF